MLGLSTRLSARVGNTAARSVFAAHAQLRHKSTSVFNTSRLVGQTVLVTGASSGIGASTAKLFARAGANLVILARRIENLEAVKLECEAAHKDHEFTNAKVLALSADVQDRKAIDKALEDTKAAGLTLDILINNAGLVRGREQIGDITDRDVDVMFRTNVIGLIHLTQKIVQDFKTRNTGTIINLGSVAGIEPYVGGSIYCATKAAVNSFNGTLRRELVNTGINVCEIMPGMVETEFSVIRYRGDKERADSEYKGLEPLSGDDVAEQIVWVASRPANVQIASILMFPTNQASATVNYRKPE